MRLIAVLLTAAFMHAHATGAAQNVTISGRDLTFKQIFAAVEKQTGYVVFGNQELFAGKRTVSVSVKNAPLKELLDLVLKDQPFDYTIDDRTIFISKKTVPPAPTVPSSQQAPVPVKGQVVDQDGKPLAGASVTVKGKKLGTATDANGVFMLDGLDPGDVLIISYTGYRTRSQPVGDRKSFIIALELSTDEIDQVQVIAYGTQTKRFNAGGVGTVKKEDLEKQPVSNPLMALAGRVAGLQISQTSGIAGSSVVVQVRGQNSLRNDHNDNGNMPLYIIDGVPFGGTSLSTPGLAPYAQPFMLNLISDVENPPVLGASPLDAINVKDIESISVLKDADATSIYGSRGANGVILITTRKGRAGKMQLDADFYSGSGKITRRMKLLNTEEYLQMRTEAFRNDNLQPGLNDHDVNGVWSKDRYTDWQDVLLNQPSSITDGQLGLSGGSSAVQYRIGSGYHRETSTFPGDYASQRISVSSALTASSPDQRFKTNFTFNFSSGSSDLPGQDITQTALYLSPNAPALYDEAGNLNWEKNTFDNPLKFRERPYRSEATNLIGNASLKYELARHLSVSTSLGYTSSLMQETSKLYKTYYNTQDAAVYPQSATFGNNTSVSWIVEPQLNWSSRIGKGYLSALAGATLQGREVEYHSQYASGFTDRSMMDNITMVPSANVTNSYDYARYKYAALFGRLSYVWDGKYILNITGRRDGSSRFGDNRRFSNFGSAGVAWIFTGEPFVKDALPFLSFGKLRGSYGTTGNDQISDYAFLNTYASYRQYQGIVGLAPSKLYNPDLRWESNKKLEAALELGFLEDAFTASVAFYRNRSSDQLVPYPMPGTVGFSSFLMNFPAIVENTGVEIEISSKNIVQEHFTWTTAFNITIPKNELVAFPGIERTPYANKYMVGEPLTIRKGFHFTGVDPATGLYTVEDKNGDHLYSAADYIVAFRGQRFFGGLNNSFTYKSFQLDFLFQFVKQEGNNYLNLFPMPGTRGSQPKEALERWQAQGDQAVIQKFSTGGLASTAYSRYRTSDASVSDASFIRLKNISLSYQLAGKLLDRIKVKQCRLYVQGQNLVTITNYLGLDPETQSLGLPPLRYLTAGLRVSL